MQISHVSVLHDEPIICFAVEGARAARVRSTSCLGRCPLLPRPNSTASRRAWLARERLAPDEERTEEQLGYHLSNHEPRILIGICKRCS